MTTDEGSLSYLVEPRAERLFTNRMRHVVNPVVGVSCGLVAGGALFVVAVQLLFGVAPSALAVIILVVAAVLYVVAVLRARVESRARGAYRVVIDHRGITRTATGLPPDRQPWARLTRWLENDEDFVVATGGWRDRAVITLPKTAIAEDEQELIREVLHAHIDPDDESISEAFTEMGWDEEPARRARPPRPGPD